MSSLTTASPSSDRNIKHAVQVVEIDYRNEQLNSLLSDYDTISKTGRGSRLLKLNGLLADVMGIYTATSADDPKPEQSSDSSPLKDVTNKLTSIDSAKQLHAS
jgi:hypothetical protein